MEIKTCGWCGKEGIRGSMAGRGSLEVRRLLAGRHMSRKTNKLVMMPGHNRDR